MKEIDRKITAGLEKLTQVQRNLIWEVAKTEGLSPLQIQFLIYLKNFPDPLRTVSSLAREFDITKATVSDAVSTLVEKGLVSKTHALTDRRSYTLKLTVRGRNIVQRVDKWQERLTEHIARFPDEIKEPVIQFLMGLIKSLFDDGLVGVARMCIACDNFVPGSADGKIRHYCRLTDRFIDEHDLNIGCVKYTSAGAG